MMRKGRRPKGASLYTFRIDMNTKLSNEPDSGLSIANDMCKTRGEQ